MKINPDYSESSFAPPKEGVHFVRIVEAEAKPGTKGPIIQWKMETFGNDEINQNGKNIWHRTDISGQYSGMLNLFLKAINPEYVGGEFDTDDCIGKELEVSISYPIDKKTGVTSQYPQVKKVSPYVGGTSIPQGTTEQDVPF